MAHTKDDYFRVSGLEREMRSHFQNLPDTLGLHQILNGLISKPNPLIKKSSRSGCFEFTHGEIRVVLRVLLKKDRDGQLIVRDTSEGDY